MDDLSIVTLMCTLGLLKWCPNSIQIERYDVIIIGAGVAGLSAATRLDQQGISVMILESQSQLGGRIDSVFLGDGRVDMGAEWVRGEDGNVVYDMMKGTDILDTSVVPSVPIWLSDRSIVSSQLNNELLGLFSEVAENDPQNEFNASMGEYLTKKYVNLANDKFGTQPDKYNIAIMALNTLEKQKLTDSGAPTWFAASADDDITPIKGNYHTSWNGKGFASFFDVLLKGFDTKQKVLLRKPVLKMEILPRLGKYPLLVSGDGFVYLAQHVIFSPSLGVLKYDHQTLFAPPLSPQKINAIETLGYGSVYKVMLLYTKRWWVVPPPGTNFTGIRFVWNCKDEATLAVQFPKGPMKNGKSWLSNILDAFVVANNPSVLSVWFVGEFVTEFEQISDDLMIEGITFALDKFLGHLYKIQRPDKMLRRDWNTNKNFRGTHSYSTVESHEMVPNAYDILGEPVFVQGIPRILFAGEATHLEHHSMVHGAIESGYREADRLIKTVFSHKSFPGSDN